MNTKQYAKIAAIGIGATLVLNAVTSLSRIFTDPHASADWSELAISMFPSLLLAVLLATFIYRYTLSLEFDESVPSGISLLQAGIKLLGAYWIVSAIPHLLIATYLIIQQATSSFKSPGSAGIIPPMIYGLLYGVAGFFFTRRTETIKKLLGVSDDA